MIASRATTRTRRSQAHAAEVIVQSAQAMVAFLKSIDQPMTCTSADNAGTVNSHSLAASGLAND
jgi:pyrroloquinoline quinone (PQQ) biosynthesis protein C